MQQVVNQTTFFKTTLLYLRPFYYSELKEDSVFVPILNLNSLS